MKKQISQRQLEANQENAKKGGVKTEEGKASSKYNATKHGLLSEQVLMEGEDEQELIKLRTTLIEELNPFTEIEFLLVDRIVSNYWRLKRALSFEVGEVICTQLMTSTGLGLMSDADKFFRYETALEKGIYKALHELERIQARRKGEDVIAPLAMDIDISDFNKNGFVS